MRVNFIVSCSDSIVMRMPTLTVLAFFSGCLAFGPADSLSQEVPFRAPLPRLLDEESCVKFAPVDFERLLSELKSERARLDADWKATSKTIQRTRGSQTEEPGNLEKQLQGVLDRLREERARRDKPSEARVPAAPVEPVGSGPRKKDANITPLQRALADSLSAVNLAQALFRAEKYDEALAAFQRVDLKGRKAEERAPILFMTAQCMYLTGKIDEAIKLLQEVAGSRGDEQLAAHAQWQLEMFRWERQVRDKLQELRKRRQAAEKTL